MYGKGWLGGTIFAIIVGFIIIGGIKSIGKVTERLVPLMALVYVVSCLLIILSNFNQIPDALLKVFHSAFSFDATTGGVLGSMIAGVKELFFQMNQELVALQLHTLQRKVTII